MRQFGALVIDWNRKVSNLISRNDEGRIVARHFAESIEPAYRLRESGARSWLDFGSGAGFPAIPLAILGVGERWTLVESRRPKTLFMRKAIEVLELPGIKVYHGRLETWLEEQVGERFIDGFSSRATMRLAPTLVMAESVVRQGGTAFLWKGSRRDEELSDPKNWDREWELTEVLDLGSGPTAVAKLIRIK